MEGWCEGKEYFIASLVNGSALAKFGALLQSWFN
jgi:hypothetical protein